MMIKNDDKTDDREPSPVLMKETRHQPSRILWIDLIKVVSTILIVMQHSISQSWVNFEEGSISWVIINIAFIVSRVGILLFFMCSGYTILSKERSVKNILGAVLRLLLVYLSWMCVYGVIEAVKLISHGQSFRVVAGGFVKCIIFGDYHVWYIFAIIGMYLLAPIVYPAVHNRKIGRYLVILAAVSTFIIPLLNRFEWFGRFEYTLGSYPSQHLYGYLIFFVLGYIIPEEINIYVGDSKEKAEKLRGVIIAFEVIVMAAVIIITAVLSYKNHSLSQFCFGDFSIADCLITIPAYAIFVNLGVSEKLKKPLSLMVGFGFSIYLMHPLILRITSDMTGILSLLRALLVYVVCFATSYLLSLCPITKMLFMDGKKRPGT